MNRLPAWTLVWIGPASTADFASTERAFRRFTDLTRFRDLRRGLSSPLVDALYEEWLTSGHTALVRYGPASAANRFPNARFETRLLPFRYDQFGDLPGVC